jgi:hypothetical protein
MKNFNKEEKRYMMLFDGLCKGYRNNVYELTEDAVLQEKIKKEVRDMDNTRRRSILHLSNNKGITINRTTTRMRHKKYHPDDYLPSEVRVDLMEAIEGGESLALEAMNVIPQCYGKCDVQIGDSAKICSAGHSLEGKLGKVFSKRTEVLMDTVTYGIMLIDGTRVFLRDDELTKVGG